MLCAFNSQQTAPLDEAVSLDGMKLSSSTLPKPEVPKEDVVGCEGGLCACYVAAHVDK